MKFLGKFLILLTAALVQFSILPNLALGQSINLFLVIIFFWSLKQNISQSYAIIFSVSLLYDILSGNPLGVSAICYLVFAFVAYAFHKNFLRSFSKISFTVFVLLSVTFFKVLQEGIFGFLGLSSFSTFNAGLQIIINSGIILLTAFFLRQKLLKAS